MVIQVTETLTANRTYYVRTSGATDPGSDTNDGLSDTACGAFLTVQHAIDVAASLHLSIYDVTIKIADDTITEAITLKSPSGSGKLILEGNTTTPSNVFFNITSANAIYAKNQSGVFLLKGLKLQTNTGGHCLYAMNATIQFENLDFGNSAGHHIVSIFNGYIEAVGNYTVSGNALYHILTGENGSVRTDLRTITYQNNPVFTYNFYADRCGCIQCLSMTFTNGGTVTGSRYNASLNGVIFTNGSGASYIPGSTAGVTATGGQYN